MSFENPSDDVLRDILAAPRTIAVVGASPDVTRASHRVAYFLQGIGHRVVPVNPQAAGMTVVMDRCPAIEYPRLYRR